MTGIKTDGAADDFDFEIGDWTVKHRRLKQRFTNCDEWIEFEGQSSTRKILGGLGNLEDNFLDFPEGAFRAIALRSYNVETGEWSIWWLDGRFPGTLDVPVVGIFTHNVGVFFADDVIEGQSVKIRFTWDATHPNLPLWEQAFSNDNGVSWETNWTMEFLPRP